MLGLKTIFVVGAGPGLGNAVAKKFGQNDFHVVLMARNQKHLDAYQQEFQKMKIPVDIQTVDAADPQSVQTAYSQAVTKVGTPDVLFYNVGITNPDQAQRSSEQLVQHYQADVVGAYSFIQTAMNDSKFTSGSRTILLTGGGLALHPMAQYLPLSIDKAALRALVQALHPALQKEGIFLGLVNVIGGIGLSEKYMPDKIAEQYWQMYQDQGPMEINY